VLESEGVAARRANDVPLRLPPSPGLSHRGPAGINEHILILRERSLEWRAEAAGCYKGHLSRSFVFVHLATPGLEVAAWSLALLQKLSERT